MIGMKRLVCPTTFSSSSLLKEGTKEYFFFKHIDEITWVYGLKYTTFSLVHKCVFQFSNGRTSDEFGVF